MIPYTFGVCFTLGGIRDYIIMVFRVPPFIIDPKMKACARFLA